MWNPDQIEERIITRGTTGANTLYGRSDLNNVMERLAGHEGLYGSLGNDTLDGGIGNYQLYGNRGSDTYVFGKGYGQDLIYDGNSALQDQDSLRLLVNPNEIEVLQDNGSLILHILGTTDQIRISSYFVQDEQHSYAYQIEKVKFANGVIWNQAQLEEHVLTRGTASDGVLYGQNELHDFMYGLEGNDQLYGEEGSDRYLFGVGARQDTLVESDSTYGNQDRLQIDVNYEEVPFTEDTKDMNIQLRNHSGDIVRLLYIIGITK